MLRQCLLQDAARSPLTALAPPSPFSPPTPSIPPLPDSRHAAYGHVRQLALVSDSTAHFWKALPLAPPVSDIPEPCGRNATAWGGRQQAFNQSCTAARRPPHQLPPCASPPAPASLLSCYLPQKAKAGVEAAGHVADLYQVAETLPADVLAKIGAPAKVRLKQCMCWPCWLLAGLQGDGLPALPGILHWLCGAPPAPQFNAGVPQYSGWALSAVLHRAPPLLAIARHIFHH